MFADPTSITIATIATDFAAVSRTDIKSIYRTSDGSRTLTISRAEGARRRYLVRLDHEKIAASPVDSSNAEVSASVYMVLDVPDWGFGATNMSDTVAALSSFLTSVNVARLLAGET